MSDFDKTNELNELKEKTAKFVRISIKLTKVRTHEYSNLQAFVEFGSSPDSIGGTNLPHFLAFVPRSSGSRRHIHIQLKRFKEGTFNTGDFDDEDVPGIENTMKQLKWCFRNEKRFYDVAENGLKRGMKIIKRIKDDLRNLAKDDRDLEVVFKDIEFIHWILSFFNEEMVSVKRRRRVEEEFLKNLSFRNYFQILTEIRHERKMHRKALKKVNPAKTEDTLNNFYKKSKGKLVKSGSKGAVYGLVSGAAWDFITGNESEVINFTFLLPILGLATGIATVFVEYNKEIIRLQEEAVKMRKLYP